MKLVLHKSYDLMQDRGVYQTAIIPMQVRTKVGASPISNKSYIRVT